MMRGAGMCSLALAALCCGCAAVAVRENPAAPEVAEALIDGISGKSVQMIEGAWKDEAFSAECVMKCDGERFTAVLLAPQMRLATLTVERPHEIRWERAPQLPESLDPEHVILDIALVVLPTDALEKALGDVFAVKETLDGKRRTVVDVERNRLHSVRQMLPDGSVYYRNVLYGYEFTVRSM